MENKIITQDGSSIVKPTPLGIFFLRARPLQGGEAPASGWHERCQVRYNSLPQNLKIE